MDKKFILIEFVVFGVIASITLEKLSIGPPSGSFIGLTNREETGEVLFKYF